MNSENHTSNACAPDAVKDTDLACLVRSFENQAPNIRELFYRLESVLSRLQGAEPCSNCDTEDPSPESLLGRLDHACSTTNSEISSLETIISRLETLV